MIGFWFKRNIKKLFAAIIKLKILLGCLIYSKLDFMQTLIDFGVQKPYHMDHNLTLIINSPKTRALNSY